MSRAMSAATTDRYPWPEELERPARGDDPPRRSAFTAEELERLEADWKVSKAILVVKRVFPGARVRRIVVTGRR